MYLVIPTAQEMDKDMDTEECNHREKVVSEELGKESTSVPSDGTARSECKQQERRKKAAMFLSRLKKGSKEDEGTAQPVYGKEINKLSSRFCCKKFPFKIVNRYHAIYIALYNYLHEKFQ